MKSFLRTLGPIHFAQVVAIIGAGLFIFFGPQVSLARQWWAGMAVGCAIMLFIRFRVVLLKHTADYFSRKASRRNFFGVLKILSTFAWFCSKPNRDNIALITTNLKKDVRQMRDAGRSQHFITIVLLWHVVFGTIVPILWDSVIRLINAVLPIGKVISKIKGF
jgi:hypothetical protein